MRIPFTSALLPRHLWVLLAAYFLASLSHFIHNAEFIAYYPNMPASIRRESVYLAWLAITGAGVAGITLSHLGLPILGAVMLGAYGLFGLDGFAHYTLAPCSEHTLATNVTIWAEAVAGLVLALCCAVFARRLFAARARRRSRRAGGPRC